MKITPLTAERLFPYFGALLVMALWKFVFGEAFPQKPELLLSASGTVAAVLIGFLGTAKAVVLSIANSDVFKRLKEAGYHRVVFDYLFAAVIAGLVFLVWSTIGLFVVRSEAMPSWYTAIWTLLGSAMLLLYLRFTMILFRMLKWA